MQENSVRNYIQEVLNNIPSDWLKLTTHRLDIYNEALAKTEFLDKFQELYQAGNTATEALSELPTAYDYIRLGHPLSTVLEWTLGQLNNLPSHHVISFASKTMPILAVLRKNLLDKKNTQIVYRNSLPKSFNPTAIREIYGYDFELVKLENTDVIPSFDGSTILVSNETTIGNVEAPANVDFMVQTFDHLGSIILVMGSNGNYVSEIQHVRRRESIAMTPSNCEVALNMLLNGSALPEAKDVSKELTKVRETIKDITATSTKPLLGSSGLSVQYGIMMGLIDEALERYPGKPIKIVVPPNCYGGTNDQARRVAACLENVEVMDLPVDGDNDMVQSVEQVLSEVAKLDAVPYIIAEIPTNPRVEVPDLEKLRDALAKTRTTSEGTQAIPPVFILDQTFCPNVQFLSEGGLLSSVQTIAYVSGSKFPSGGKCTAGYCVANLKSAEFMGKIEKHMNLCDNEATLLQVELLAEQMPSMLQRIADAYKNTREFVNFIRETLPSAKINFVSEELAEQGFTPSVFSLDLPTKGDSDEEREAYKRELNNKLIDMMISEIPNESKYCVSYGQLKGCYWTIPATSTQGTTKESDKDYIARVALSANMDLEHHKAVFKRFVEEI